MSQYGPEIWIAEDRIELAQEAAKRVLELLKKKVAAKGSCSIVLSGGRTPKMFYEELARHRYAPWDKVIFFFGDERMFPLDHPESNYRLARETLFVPLCIADSQIHPILPSEEPAFSASAYSTLIEQHWSQNEGLFDLVLLGMGPDGHTASVFPGDPVLLDPGSKRICIEVLSAPKPPSTRVSLTPFALNQARSIMVLVDGKEKAAAVCAALESDADPSEIPIRSIISSNVTWLIDRLAAAGLTQTGT